MVAQFYCRLVSSPSIVSGRPARPVSIPAKGSGRTLRYCSPAPAGISFFLGRLGAASCKNLGGTGWRLAVGRSLDGGFFWLVEEVCAGEAFPCRLSPRTTWVAFLTDFSVRASLDPRPRDAQRRWRSRSVGSAANLIRDVPGSLWDLYLPQLAQDHSSG